MEARMSEPHWNAPTSIDAHALTTASWTTLTTIGFRLVCGFTEREVAMQLGVPRKQVVERLDALRDELAG
jgi:hypothetical protein